MCAPQREARVNKQQYNDLKFSYLLKQTKDDSAKDLRANEPMRPLDELSPSYAFVTVRVSASKV